MKHFSVLAPKIHKNEDFPKKYTKMKTFPKFSEISNKYQEVTTTFSKSLQNKKLKKIKTGG